MEDKKGEIREIIEDECVECGVCFRADICPVEAIYPQELS